MYHFIEQTKHAWEVYVALNKKYEWMSYWCKQNKISEAKIQILKFWGVKFKHPQTLGV